MNKEDRDVKKILDVNFNKKQNLYMIEKKIEGFNRKSKYNLRYLFPVGCLLLVFIIFWGYYNKSYDSNINLDDGNLLDDSNIFYYENELSLTDFLYDITDPKVLYELSSHVAIVKITSIDGVSRINQKTNTGVLNPYTYGNAEVLAQIKGSFKDKNIKYVRTGGRIPYLEWLKGDVDPDKLLSLAINNGATMEELKRRIVDYRYPGDIDIEVGKVYLVFMTHNQEYNFENQYAFLGFQYGMRKIPFYSSLIPLEKLRVLDNTNGSLVNLADIVDF